MTLPIIATHRQTIRGDGWEFGRYKCITCGLLAHYWSQAGYPNGKRGGEEIWHCQRHRAIGRELATTSCLLRKIMEEL